MQIHPSRSNPQSISSVQSGREESPVPTPPDFSPSHPDTVQPSPEGLEKTPTRLGWRWFHKLPIRRKQLLALIASEAISVLGLVGIGALLIVLGGRNQLLAQARSEVAVTGIAYNMKLDQMAAAFQVQSEDATLIAAAKDYAADRSLSDELQTRLQAILEHQATANAIEYATLVDANAKIIASANANRTGDVFNPDGLVTQALIRSRQVQASAIVRWSELQRESPPLPETLQDQDALIRYTVTPVRDPGSNKVLGALISGDVVNGKPQIVKDTLAAFGNGYSAVYQIQPDQTLQLTTSLDLGEMDDPDRAAVNVALSDSTLLKQAAAAERTVTRRVKIGDQMYTVAAQPIRGIDQAAVAVLVRGTSEANLNAMLRKNLAIQLGIASLVLLTDVALAALLGRSIANPIVNLQRLTRRFAAGDRQVRAEVFAPDEVGALTTAFNELADSVTASEVFLKDAAEQERRVNEIVLRMRESVDRQTIFATTLEEIRSTLQADRTLVYLFDPDWGGKVVAESVELGWRKVLGACVDDPCFAEQYAQLYKDGRVRAIDNIYAAGLTECYIRQLETMQALSNLVAPILVEGKLLGLLIAHQCSRSRHWHESEINLLRQIAIQLGFTLEQADLFAEKEQARQLAEVISEEQRQRRETLQQQLVELLTQVENAAEGDLTVRAEVTAGEIGTVADFFNAIVESLRQIVTQVKLSAEQVNTALGENERSVEQLAQSALQQSQETNRVLDSIEQMNRSIYAVSESARQAAEVARTASTTAEAGGTAMDLTVRNILGLRETVGETAKKVKRLGESSQQISKVVSLINQIAIQTNLLAINAGIEAARAGEEGQGFAVIAEEVRELAVRSATATQEIEKIVANIQRETGLVVNAMEQSTIQVVEGTQVVEQAKHSLQQILEVSSQIDRLVQSISTATLDQVETSDVISRLMQEVADISRRTSESSRDVSIAIQQTAAVAQALQSSVGAFHLGHEA